MEDGFRFHHDLEVRYGDIDSQGHVNNACYFTYFEQARVRYLEELGLWDLRDFDQIGIILAETTCTFISPIGLRDRIRVGMRIREIGTKSMISEHRIETWPEGEEKARGRAVLVAYDYRARTSIPVPASWRQAILAFEGLA